MAHLLNFYGSFVFFRVQKTQGTTHNCTVLNCRRYFTFDKASNCSEKVHYIVKFLLWEEPNGQRQAIRDMLLTFILPGLGCVGVGLGGELICLLTFSLAGSGGVKAGSMVTNTLR